MRTGLTMPSKMHRARKAAGNLCLVTACWCFLISAIYKTNVLGELNLTWVSSIGLVFLTLGLISIFGRVFEHRE